jgi:hypothetical protein
MYDAGRRSGRKARQTLERSARIGDPLRVDVDDAAGPIGNKNKIGRRLGYIKIPELANLRTSRPSFCPLAESPKQRLPKRDRKPRIGEWSSYGTEGARCSPFLRGGDALD